MCTGTSRESAVITNFSHQNNTMDYKTLGLSFLKCLLVQLHWVFDCIVDFAFSLYYDNKKKIVPPVRDDLLLQSATSLAKKIRQKEVTSEEIVRTFIKRCKEVNPIINAIVEDRYEAAIEEAKSVDDLIRNSEDPEIFAETKPFLGIPFTTKESNAAKGLNHSMGLVRRRNYKAPEDATVIGFMKEAGAIIIGKTNIPELNMWMESRNKVYGQANNPYDTTRTVGGSSGGDAAIVAACGVPIAVGSDIGGSIRIPAYCNGVYGLKPSEGMTPMKGIGLRKKDYMDTMAESGPICKYAEDLEPFLKVLINENASKIKLGTPVDVKKIRVFYQEGSGDLRCSLINSELRKALLKVVDHLRDATGAATKIKIPGTEYSFRLWRYWMTREEFKASRDLMNGEGTTSAATEIYNLICGNSQIMLYSIFNMLNSDVFPQENPEWAREKTSVMKKFLEEKLGDDGILVFPSAPFPAMYHHSSYLRPYNFAYFCIFNVIRFPVCQVPLGLDKNGLPIGVQIVAGPKNDHLCIAVAKELEKTFGGWVPFG